MFGVGLVILTSVSASEAAGEGVEEWSSLNLPIATADVSPDIATSSVTPCFTGDGGSGLRLRLLLLLGV